MSDAFTTGLDAGVSGGAPPGWKQRLRTLITFTSPTGTKFAASWQGNEIQLSKRVGRFDAPEAQGTTTQDMGASGLLYPLTLFFEGDSHDVESMRFVQAMQTQYQEPWVVVHPVYGSLDLVPLSATLSADPTGSANVTRVETQWLEPGPALTMAPVADLSGQITGLAGAVDADAAAQFQTLAELADPEAAAALVAQGQTVIAAVQNSPLRNAASGLASARAAFDNAYATVLNLFTEPVLDLVAIAGGVQLLVSIPAAVAGDLSGRLQAYSSMVEGVLNSFVPDATPESRNAAVVTELVVTAALTSMAKTVTVSAPGSRDQAVDAISCIGAALTTVTTALDAAQTLQSGSYFSASRTWSGLARLMAMVQALLLALLFDLKIAKRFTLDRPRTPIDITITEYGGLGVADINLDLFLVTNGLRDLDVLLLPSGREVVVYA